MVENKGREGKGRKVELGLLGSGDEDEGGDDERKGEEAGQDGSASASELLRGVESLMGKSKWLLRIYIFFPFVFLYIYGDSMNKKKRKKNRNRCRYTPNHHNVRLSPFVVLFQNGGFRLTM